MLKLTGLVLIITFSTVFGAVLSAREKRKREILEELVGLTEYVSKEILRKRPLDDIIKDGTLDNTHIKAPDRKTLNALLNSQSFGGSSGELLSRFISFYGTLGRGASVETEHKSCECFLDVVKPLYDAFHSESSRHSGMYLKLGTIFGLAVCILVI